MARRRAWWEVREGLHEAAELIPRGQLRVRVGLAGRLRWDWGEEAAEGFDLGMGAEDKQFVAGLELVPTAWGEVDARAVADSAELNSGGADEVEREQGLAGEGGAIGDDDGFHGQLVEAGGEFLGARSGAECAGGLGQLVGGTEEEEFVEGVERGVCVGVGDTESLAIDADEGAAVVLADGDLADGFPCAGGVGGERDFVDIEVPIGGLGGSRGEPGWVGGGVAGGLDLAEEFELEAAVEADEAAPEEGGDGGEEEQDNSGDADEGPTGGEEGEDPGGEDDEGDGAEGGFEEGLEAVLA